MTQKLSNIYKAYFKKNRGKASEGFIRPTIGEYFMTHKDFVEIESTSGGWLRTFSGDIGDDSGIGTYSNFTYSEINARFDANTTFQGGSPNITKGVGGLEEGDLLLNSSEGSLIEGTLQEIE
jgi:hypothetical protein